MRNEPVTVEGTDLMAQCLQHETDHLDGMLYIDRLPKEDRKRALRDIRRSDWFLSGVQDAEPQPGTALPSAFGGA